MLGMVRVTGVWVDKGVPALIPVPPGSFEVRIRVLNPDRSFRKVDSKTVECPEGTVQKVNF